jgi:hypothetical protein
MLTKNPNFTVILSGGRVSSKDPIPRGTQHMPVREFSPRRCALPITRGESRNATRIVSDVATRAINQPRRGDAKIARRFSAGGEAELGPVSRGDA